MQPGLEIGGGPYPKYRAYVQVDAIDWSERTGLEYSICDARKLPFEDGSFLHVYASNLLEHFPPGQTTEVLTEWARVTSPGGRLEVVVPDAMGILRDYFHGVNSWTDCAERLLGSRDYPGNEHLTCFTIAEFPGVLAEVHGLKLLHCDSTHSGGGVTAVAVRE